MGLGRHTKRLPSRSSCNASGLSRSDDVRYAHHPVLCQTVVELLVRQTAGVYLDGTVGGGGHAAAMAERLDPRGRVIGIDKDTEAIRAARQRLQGVQPRVDLVHGDFRDLPSILTDLGVEAVDGVLLDLGVSSYQIDTPDRGFSYMADGPLDMRMDGSSPMTASDLVNQSPPTELERLLIEYGEERLTRPLVRAIVRQRQAAPITTTGQLVSVIRAVVAHRPLYKTCARVFQALRIAVNTELDGLRHGLDAVMPFLRPGGRVGVISYHSLEDRLVKHGFVQFARGCSCPPDFPRCVCHRQPVVTIVTPHPICPTAEEIRLNPRARSAKFRVVERLSTGNAR